MLTNCERAPLFLIGKDSRGRWVAQKQHGKNPVGRGLHQDTRPRRAIVDIAGLSHSLTHRDPTSIRSAIPQAGAAARSLPT